MSDHIAPLNPPSLARPVGFSHGYEVKSGRVIFLAGQVARDTEGSVVGRDDLVAQFRQVCENLRAVVEAAGGRLTDVAKLTIYVLDVAEYKRRARDLGAVYREYFGRHFPAMTLVGVRDLFDASDGCVLEIEGYAVIA